MFTAIDHPALSCYDVPAQIAWYCRHLGMRVVASAGDPPTAALIGYGDGVRGGAVIELMPAKDPGPPPVEAGRFQPGLRHLAFRVSDFDAAYATLAAAGVAFLSEPGQAMAGGKIVSFRDPEGNELQIVQR